MTDEDDYELRPFSPEAAEHHGETHAWVAQAVQELGMERVLRDIIDYIGSFDVMLGYMQSLRDDLETSLSNYQSRNEDD